VVRLRERLPVAGVLPEPGALGVEPQERRHSFGGTVGARALPANAEERGGRRRRHARHLARRAQGAGEVATRFCPEHVEEVAVGRRETLARAVRDAEERVGRGGRSGQVLRDAGPEERLHEGRVDAMRGQVLPCGGREVVPAKCSPPAVKCR
jgi:hypothetical protein